VCATCCPFNTASYRTRTCCNLVISGTGFVTALVNYAFTVTIIEVSLCDLEHRRNSPFLKSMCAIAYSMFSAGDTMSVICCIEDCGTPLFFCVRFGNWRLKVTKNYLQETEGKVILSVGLAFSVTFCKWMCVMEFPSHKQGGTTSPPPLSSLKSTAYAFVWKFALSTSVINITDYGFISVFCVRTVVSENDGTLSAYFISRTLDLFLTSVFMRVTCSFLQSERASERGLSRSYDPQVLIEPLVNV
jgi:hypothetical protein